VNPASDLFGHATEPAPKPRRVVLVTGLSGAGKASILRALEDLGYEAVDNPPLPLMEEMVLRAERPMAIGIDTRSRGFDPAAVVACVTRLRSNPALRLELIFAWADQVSLLRRYTATRRRHPMAASGRVADGITAETELTTPLRAAADLFLDTSNLDLPMLRRVIEQRFSGPVDHAPETTLLLTSFAFPAGLPLEADLVFDARFLRNPHYVLGLRDLTGLDAAVGAYVAADPDFAPFLDKVTELLTLLLPRFLQEGKKYVTVAIGCTGGKHRSVHVVQMLAARLNGVIFGASEPETPSWRIAVSHRELMRAQDRVEQSRPASDDFKSHMGSRG
jgi:UPF0042 nucleotide-binding protein